MAQSTAEINKRYNEKMPVVSFRIRQDTKTELERVCREMECDPGTLIKGLLRDYVFDFDSLKKSFRQQKSDDANIEILRQKIADFLAAGGDFFQLRSVLEQFRRDQNTREKTNEEPKMKSQKLTKSDIQRALTLSRQILEDGGASLEDSREAAAVFLAAGGDPAELAVLAKGKPTTPKTADEIKAEMLAKSLSEQDRHLAKARGWG